MNKAKVKRHKLRDKGQNRSIMLKGEIQTRLRETEAADLDKDIRRY